MKKNDFENIEINENIKLEYRNAIHNFYNE